MNSTQQKTKTTETTTATLNLYGCEITRQLNGNKCYLFFTGTERQIIDAHTSLWNYGAFDCEYEMLNDDTAFLVCNPQKLLKALFNRQVNVLSANNTEQYKHHKGGFASIAWSEANRQFSAIACVRWVEPMTFQTPNYYRMQSRANGPEWQTERFDATCA